MEQDDDEGGGARVPRTYERQVLLYSALIHEKEGVWPSKATIESLVDGPM